MITLLINLIVMLLGLGLVWWVINMILAAFPPPAPVAKIVPILFALLCVLLVIGVLLGGVSLPIGHWR